MTPSTDRDPRAADRGQCSLSRDPCAVGRDGLRPRQLSEDSLPRLKCVRVKSEPRDFVWSPAGYGEDEDGAEEEGEEGGDDGGRRGAAPPVAMTPPSSTRNCCPYCGLLKKGPADLERHLRKHTGERPFICKVRAAQRRGGGGGSWSAMRSQ